jgi:hypothetical protein
MSNRTPGPWGNPPFKEKGSLFFIFFITHKQHFNFELYKDDLHAFIRP